MNKYIALTFFSALIFAFTSCRPEADLEPTASETFIKLKGDPIYALEAVDAKMHPDGSLILLADAIDVENNLTKPALLKVDINGVTIWKNIIETEQKSYSLTIESDGNYIICGEIPGGNTKFNVIKVSDAGSITASYTNSYLFRAKGCAVYDNKIYVTGEGPGTNNWIKPSVVELSSNLDSLFFNQYQGDFINISNNSFYKINNGDPTMVFALNSFKSGKAEISYSEIFNSSAQTSATYPDLETEYVMKNFTNLFDKEYAITGNSGNDMYYARVSTGSKGGTIAFEKIKSNTDATAIAHHFTGIIIGGSYYGDASKGEEDIYFAKINTEGDISYEKIYGGSASDRLKTIIALPNGTLLIYGDTSLGDIRNLILLKTDINGEL